jgi:lysophospholipase L1-like esterase
MVRVNNTAPDGSSPLGARRARLRQWMILVALVGVALLALISLAEVVLRVSRPDDRFYPYHRNSKELFYPSEQITPGVSGVSRFTTNSFGTRGPELNGERVRILTIGGSTTACTVLDDEETWPALLMDYMNHDVNDSAFVWVTNSGIDGLNTQHHIMHAKYLLPRLPKIDYVIVYAGMNDVGMWLYAEKFDPHYLDDPNHWSDRVGEAFKVSNYTPKDLPWYKHFELWKSASIAKDLIASRLITKTRREGSFVEDAELKWMEEARRARQEREKRFVHRAKMETLPVALQSYRDNLALIVRLVREAGAEPVLMAQAIQNQLLNEDESRRLWMGAMDGGQTYVKQEQMLELINTFNLGMREVARQEGVVFVDLPDLVRGQHGLFYDSAHFNEKGARVVARALADQLGPMLRKRGSRPTHD